MLSRKYIQSGMFIQPRSILLMALFSAVSLSTLRAANYMLGTHPVSSTSYVSGVGTSSKLKAYGNNRADNTFIPGGVVPGYIIIKPDFPECIDDFGFLWFESEYVIDVASKWILAANAADAIVK